MDERQRLNLDLDSLFPGESFTVGSTTVFIKPLGIKQIALIAKKIKGLGNLLNEEKITWDNFQQPENLVKLVTIILDNFPEVLEEASNIAIEDIELLPVDMIVDLLNKVIEVNLASKEKLEGNFKSLAGKFSALMQETTKTTPKSKSQKQSKN
jgi:hypothetical protein